MKKWFPLVMVVALASIGTPLRADIFDRLVQDTAEESIPLTNDGSEVVDPAPATSEAAPTTLAPGYPFKTGCCQTRNACISGLWQGYCSRGHGACDRMMTKFADGGCRHRCKGGCGKIGCSTETCGHGGKGFGQVQWGQIQHGKGFSGCRTCGQTPCGCHANNHQKSFLFGDFGKSWGSQGCTKGLTKGGWGNANPLNGLGMKINFRVGLFDWPHHSGTCGKSKGVGFGKGGCSCGGGELVKGWNQKGSVIWRKSRSMGVPFGLPTPSYDPPVELEIHDPVDSLPVPSTPT